MDKGTLLRAALFTVMTFFCGVRGCHQPSHIAKRDLSSLGDRHVTIEEFFPSCLSSFSANDATVTWSWSDVVDFALKDTGWFVKTDVDSCSDDTVACWQHRLSEFISTASPYYKIAIDCIREFGVVNGQQEGLTLERKRRTLTNNRRSERDIKMIFEDDENSLSVETDGPMRTALHDPKFRRSQLVPHPNSTKVVLADTLAESTQKLTITKTMKTLISDTETNTTYLYVRGRMGGYGAARRCETLGGRLATLNDEKANDAFAEFYGKIQPRRGVYTKRPVYIGLYHSTEGWKWSDGRTLDPDMQHKYLNIKRPARRRTCVAAAMHRTTVTWIPIVCARKLGFVCELTKERIHIVPTNATTTTAASTTHNFFTTTSAPVANPSTRPHHRPTSPVPTKSEMITSRDYSTAKTTRVAHTIDVAYSPSNPTTSPSPNRVGVNEYSALCPKVDVGDFAACVGKKERPEQEERWSDFEHLLQFGKDYFSCSDCSSLENQCWHTRFAGSVKPASHIAFSTKSCAEEFGSFGSLRYFSNKPNGVIYGRSLFLLRYTSPENCAQACLSNRLCTSFEIKRESLSCYGNQGSVIEGDWKFNTMYDGYELNIANFKSEESVVNVGRSLEEGPALTLQVSLGAVLVHWDTEFMNATRGRLLRASAACTNDNRATTLVVPEANGRALFEDMPYGVNCKVAVERIAPSMMPVSKPAEVDVLTPIDPPSLLRISDVTSASATLDWRSPQGTGVTSYNVEWAKSEDYGFGSAYRFHAEVEYTSIGLHHLESAKTYIVKVAAVTEEQVSSVRTMFFTTRPRQQQPTS